MSKTKKRLFYSVIVAVAILLAFVAVTVMTTPDGTSVIAEAGGGQSALSTVTVASDDSAYGEFDALTSLGGPGTVADSDIITSASVSDAEPILDASELEDALKTGGKYYLLSDISINASTSNSSAAAGGTFSGVLYGNGHTVTVTVSQGTFTSSDYKNYGFLVKSLSGGTIRDLNLVIQAGDEGGVSFGKVLKNRSKQTMNIASGTTVSQYIMQVGGIAGEMTGGLIHNCTVTYSGNIRFIINGLEDASASDIGYGGDNAARIFGGMVGGMSGGIISYSTLNLNGQIYNTGTQTNNGENHMFVLTGGIAGVVEGATTFRKVTVQGSGRLIGQVNIRDTNTWGSGSPSTDAYTGGLIGYVTGYGQPDFNGVYLNLTYSASNGDSDAFDNAAKVSEGFTGAVKTHYTRTDGVLNNAYANQYDSRANDNGGDPNQKGNNVFSGTYVSESRTSYGIGGVETSAISNVSLNNVYVSPTMANVIENHHPYAIHEIQYGQSTTANVKWVRWNWTYTVIDATTLGNTAIFAPTMTISNTATAANVTADTANQQRAVYFRLSGQGTNNFVYSITQGTSSLYDVFESAAKTYDKTGTVYVPVLYAGHKGNVTSTVRREGMNLTDIGSSTVNIYANTVSASMGSYLYMDYDMTRGYDGTDRYADGYQGSGNNYTYTYNGDMLYVPAFAGYKTSYGTGEKVSFTEDELNSMGLSSTHFSLSSSYTITNSGNVNYNHYNYLHWDGAGNVGTYSMTFARTGTNNFITKDGNNYYCAFMDSYPEKTIQVVPCQLDLEWYVGDLVYDGTVKDVATKFADLPGGTGLGNNDGSNLSVAVSYSASNENLLVQNKPYHAGGYTAKATLTYGGTTENPMTGNFTLANSEKAFTVGKVKMTVQPENAVSVYGDDHAALLAGVKVVLSGAWVGGDQSSFVFTAKTVDDTIGWATTKGTYPTTVGVTLAEGAVEELINDYDFVVTQGTLTINERPINGTLKINGGVYNGTNYNAVLTIDESVKVGTDSVYTLDYVLNGEATEEAVNAGEYVIRITPEANKYSIGTIVIDGKDELYADGVTKLVIDQRSVDVTLTFDNGYVYDGNNKVTGYSVQAQSGDAGVMTGEDAGLAMSYNGEAAAILPASYTAVATFSNANYKAGTITGGTFTVERADLSKIRIDENSVTYDGTGKSIGYTLVGVASEENIASLAGTVTVTYNKSTSLPVNADIYEVEINVAEGVAYNAKSVSTTFIVNKADITFSPVTETTYTGKNIEPEFSMTAPGMEDASSLKNYVTAQSTVIFNASTYDVTLVFAGTNNYNAKTEKYTLTVNRADLAIDVADGQTLTYNASAQTPAYSIAALFDGDEYGEVTATVSGDNATEGQAIKAGSYTFTISVAQSVNYNAVEETVTFTIEKYVLTLIGANEQFVTVIKDAGDVEVTEISRYLPYMDLALIDDTGKYTRSSLSFNAFVDGAPADEISFTAGKAVFTVEIMIPSIDTSNYEFETKVITVNVLDASITITVNGEENTLTSVTFGEQLAITAEGSYGDNPGEVVNDVTWYSAADGYTSALAEQPTDAGDYMAVFKYTFGTDSNYVTRTLYLTISPKAVTVTLDGSAISVTYGDEITLAGATYTTDAGDIDLAIDYATNAVKFSPVGNYTLSGTVSAVTDGNLSNYAFTIVPGTLKIAKKTVYIKASDVTATYGDEVIFSNYTVYTDDGGTVWTDYANAAQLKVSFSVQDGILTVGQYDVTVTGENSNYTVVATTEKGKLNVETRAITITVNDIGVTYGTQELPAVTGSITGGSLVYGDTLGEISAVWNAETALAALDAAEYALTSYATLSATLNSAQTGENYDIAFENTTKLNVTPRTVTITFVGWQTAGAFGTDNKVTYNAQAWTPSGIVEGVINGDAVDVATDDSGEIKDAGVYTRTLSLTGADVGNYLAEAYVATLEILPCETVISAGETSYTYTYGDEKTAITPTVRVLDGDTDDGSFVQKYYVGTNTGVTGTQVNWDDVWNAGTYTVVVSYSSSNYTADPVNVTIVVKKKMLDKVDAKNGGDLGTSVYNATNVNITADMIADISSFSGLEDYISVVYKSGDNVVTVIRNAGEYTVDLVLAQNENYGINGDGDSLLNAAATYTVTKAQASNLTFSLTYANKVYTGDDMSDYIRTVIAVSGINGEPVTGASLELTGSDGKELQPVDSGIYRIYVQATGMSNYDDMSASEYVGEFTIDKVYVAIDAIALPDATYTYDSLEKALTATGIQQNAVLRKIVYEYTSDDYVSSTGVINAGVYNVKMTVLLDMLNSRFDSDVTLETVVDEEAGECYKYELTATITINKAVPEVTIDKNTLATYFDGYDHAIGFGIAGVGSDSVYSATYDGSVSAGQTVTVEGLGTFTVSYYKDSAYNNMLTGEDGTAALPITVLLDNGKTVPYYLLISFTSENSNYADKEYKNSGYDMALFVMQSVVTLSFNSLTVPYGTLKNRSAANEYVNANMKYTYTVNDEGSASVNYDPEAMLEISYNLGSFDVNTGTYDISVEARAAKTEYADSVTAVVRNASSIKLNITAADVTDEMIAAFTDLTDDYGKNVYTAEDFVWTVKGIMNEDVAYTVSYNGDSDFSIADAGDYVMTVSIPEGNYKKWSGTVKLSIAKVGLDVVWTMDGQSPVDGAFTKTYDGKPADVTASAVGADGVTVSVVYVNSEGMEIEAPYVVGTHTAKAVLSDGNYYVNGDCETVTVVIEAIVLDEETIRGWISDDSDQYGSVQGIDITGLPEGFGAVSIEYRAGDVVYDMTTIRNATVGDYSATVTVSNGSSTGSATFTYTVLKREIVFTVSVSGTAGVKPTVSNATLVSDKSLASGDTAKVSNITFSGAYSQDMPFGVYKLSDYVSAIEITFSAHGDCYDYRIETGDLRLVPASAPVIVDTVINHNTVTFTFETEGIYAYRIGSRGTWIETSNESNTLIVSGLNAETTYSIYIAYAGFTSVNSLKSLTTTSDPDKILEMIDEIMEGGLTTEKQAQYESILSYYEGISQSDRAEIQAEYDALVSQFEALMNGGTDTTEGDGTGAAVIAVSVICGVLILGAIAGVIAAAVIKKRKKNSAEA